MGFYSKKLLKRIADELGIKIPYGTYIRRTRAGYWLKSSGAWSWNLWHDNTKYAYLGEIGSSYTVRECAMAKELIMLPHSGIHLE